MQSSTKWKIRILAIGVLTGILVPQVALRFWLKPARPVPPVAAKKTEIPRPPTPTGLKYLDLQRPYWFSALGIRKKPVPRPTTIIGTPESQTIFAAFLADLLRDDVNGDGLLTGTEITNATERGYPRSLIPWMFKTMRERTDADKDGRLSEAEQRLFFTMIGVRQTIASLASAPDWTNYDADKDGRLSRQERAQAAAQLDPVSVEQRRPDRGQTGESGARPTSRPKPSRFLAANHKLNDVDFPADACFFPASLAADRTCSMLPELFRAYNLAAPDPLAALVDGDDNGWIDDRESFGLFWAILKTYDEDDDGILRGREQRALNEDMIFDEAMCRFFPEADKDQNGWFSSEEILALLPPILKVYDFNHNGKFEPWEKFRFSRDTWKAKPGTGLETLCQQGGLLDRQLDQAKRDSILVELRRRLTPMMNPIWNKEEQDAAWQTLLVQADTNQNGVLEPQEIFEMEQELIADTDKHRDISHFPPRTTTRGHPGSSASRIFQETDTDGNGIISLTESDARWKLDLKTENKVRSDPIYYPAAFRATMPPSIVCNLDIDDDDNVSPFEIFYFNMQAREPKKPVYAPAGPGFIPSTLDISFDGLYAAFLDWDHDNRLTGAEAKAARAIFLELFDQNDNGQIDECEPRMLLLHGFKFLRKDRPRIAQPNVAATAPAPHFQPPVLDEPEPKALKNAFETIAGSAKTRAALAGFLDELMKHDLNGDGRLTDAETAVPIKDGMRKLFFCCLDQQLCRFDLNGDGKISPQERELFLDLAGGPASTMYAWISRLDQNQDGKLDHQERNRFSRNEAHPFAASAGLRIAIPQDVRKIFFLNYYKNLQLPVKFEGKDSMAELVLLPTDDICMQADKNHDGWLDPEEALAARRATFLAADRNGSGWIEIEEAEAWDDASGIGTAAWRFFPDADTNQDGWLDQAEITRVLPKLLVVYDFNGDGKLDGWECNCLARHLKMAKLPANATLAEMKQLGCSDDEDRFLERNEDIIFGFHQKLAHLENRSQAMINETNWRSILKVADRNRNDKLDLVEAFWLDRQYLLHTEEAQTLKDGAKLYPDICDTDGDGVIGGNESFLIQEKMVERLDQDGNGIVSIAESLPLRIQAGKSELRDAKCDLLGNFFGDLFIRDLLFRAVDDNGEKTFSKFLLPYLDLDKDGKITMWEIQSFDNRFSSKNRLAGAAAQSLEENLAKALPFLDHNHDGKLTAAEKNTAIGILLALADKERLGRIDIGTVEVAHKEFPAFDDPVAVPRRDVGRLVRRKLTEQELLQRYDLDGDGKLSPEERARATEDMKNDVENNILVPPEEE